jgi:hypothetical protein
MMPCHITDGPQFEDHPVDWLRQHTLNTVLNACEDPMSTEFSNWAEDLEPQDLRERLVAIQDILFAAGDLTESAADARSKYREWFQRYAERVADRA